MHCCEKLYPFKNPTNKNIAELMLQGNNRLQSYFQGKVWGFADTDSKLSTHPHYTPAHRPQYYTPQWYTNNETHRSGRKIWKTSPRLSHYDNSTTRSCWLSVVIRSHASLNVKSVPEEGTKSIIPPQDMRSRHRHLFHFILLEGRRWAGHRRYCRLLRLHSKLP